MTDAAVPADLSELRNSTPETTFGEPVRSCSTERGRNSLWRRWIGTVVVAHRSGVPF